MVLPRILTAVLLIPLVLAVIWYGTIPFFLFVLGVSLLCLWEFCLIAEEGGYPNQIIMSLLGGVSVLLALYLDGVSFLGPVHHAPSPVFILLLWIFLLFVRELFSRDKGHSFLRIITSVSGVILCSLMFGHLLLLRDLRLVAGEGFRYVGREIVFFLFLTVWAVDIGAWLVGRWVGRFRLAPRLSPKKTWEGSIGGVFFGCVMALFLREAFMGNQFGPLEVLIYGFFLGVICQISDLAESLMKRSFHVKNSSELLPGHGGILDRFDSFIFAAPFFYYVLLGTGRFQ